MDLASLFSAAYSNERQPARPHPTAQRMELRDRWKRAQETTAFAPGDLVRQKPGLGILKDPDTCQAIYWGAFDIANPAHRLCLEDQLQRGTVLPVFDCFIAVVADDTRTLAFYVTDSATLELDPEQVEESAT